MAYDEESGYPCSSCAALRERVKELEELYSREIEAHTTTEGERIRLQGIADRVEDVEGMAIAFHDSFGLPKHWKDGKGSTIEGCRNAARAVQKFLKGA